MQEFKCELCGHPIKNNGSVYASELNIEFTIAMCDKCEKSLLEMKTDDDLDRIMASIFAGNDDLKKEDYE
jgi:hypothetical protein